MPGALHCDKLRSDLTQHLQQRSGTCDGWQCLLLQNCSSPTVAAPVRIVYQCVTPGVREPHHMLVFPSRSNFPFQKQFWMGSVRDQDGRHG